MQNRHPVARTSLTCHTYRCRRHPSPGKLRGRVPEAFALIYHAPLRLLKIGGPSTAPAMLLPCYCPKTAQQTPFKSPPSTRIEGKASVAPTVRSTAVTRASGAPPAAVGGAAFGPTSSDAVSEHGHGHHLFRTESETGAAVARSRAGFSCLLYTSPSPRD